MNELVCLELAVLLWVVHVVVQAAFAIPALGVDYLSTARDANPAPKGVYFPRATRALHNYVENFAPFAATDLALFFTHHPTGLGPTIWIVARIVYLPIYVAGVPKLRTLVWIFSLVGLLMMLAQLAL